MSFTLYPAQDEHARCLYRALLSNRGALDTSQTGTGKTIVAATIAAHWRETRGEVAVVCPKSVITNWERVLEASGVDPLFVLNYEKLRMGRKGIVQGRRMSSGKWFKWDVPEDTLLIFDEVQYSKGETSQNAHLLIGARRQKYHTLCLSATAAKDPTEMRALGYALYLHDLNDRRGNNTWSHWMQRHGCSKDHWGTWKMKTTPRAKEQLKDLNEEMFQRRRVAHGITTADMPGAFKESYVTESLLDYDGAADIYEECGITEDVVDSLLGEIREKKAAANEVVVDILRARQLVEALKIPHFIEEVTALRAEGKSVVVFLNFRESIRVMQEAFPDAGVIIGEQKDRDEQIDAFQNNETDIMLVSSQAGGTGVSLHDEKGGHPRAVLISPTFSTHVHHQVLGRCHRANMKSDVTQKVMVAAGTIEEYVFTKCQQSTETMNTLLQ